MRDQEIRKKEAYLPKFVVCVISFEVWHSAYRDTLCVFILGKQFLFSICKVPSWRTAEYRCFAPSKLDHLRIHL